MSDSKANIHQRIAAITGEIKAVQKTGKNNEQKYDFIEYDAVTAELRGKLADHGVTILQNMVKDGRQETEITSKYGQKGIHIIIDFIFTVTNVDDPSDKIEFFWQGEASDYGDKATNKACTAAEKYFLLKLFKIGTKDDPDAESPGRGVADKKEPKPAVETQVVFASKDDITDIRLAACEVTGLIEESEVDAWLKEKNIDITKLPKAWVKPALEKLKKLQEEA